MEKIGLKDLLNVQGAAILKGDKQFAEKMSKLLNEKITVDISKEDWDYIIKNYTE